MKLTTWEDSIDQGAFLEVSKREALAIIKSLVSQILNDSSNAGRVEHHLENGSIFTIAVKVEDPWTTATHSPANVNTANTPNVPGPGWGALPDRPGG